MEMGSGGALVKRDTGMGLLLNPEGSGIHVKHSKQTIVRYVKFRPLAISIIITCSTKVEFQHFLTIWKFK